MHTRMQNHPLTASCHFWLTQIKNLITTEGHNDSADGQYSRMINIFKSDFFHQKQKDHITWPTQQGLRKLFNHQDGVKYESYHS